MNINKQAVSSYYCYTLLCAERLVVALATDLLNKRCSRLT